MGNTAMCPAIIRTILFYDISNVIYTISFHEFLDISNVIYTINFHDFLDICNVIYTINFHDFLDISNVIYTISFHDFLDISNVIYTISFRDFFMENHEKQLNKTKSQSLMFRNYFKKCKAFFFSCSVRAVYGGRGVLWFSKCLALFICPHCFELCCMAVHWNQGHLWGMLSYFTSIFLW